MVQSVKTHLNITVTFREERDGEQITQLRPFVSHSKHFVIQECDTSYMLEINKM